VVDKIVVVEDEVALTEVLVVVVKDRVSSTNQPEGTITEKVRYIFYLTDFII